MQESTRTEAHHALRFAGEFLAWLTAVIVLAWLLGAAFRLSRELGYSLLALVAVALFLSAHLWIRVLPGLLIFGVLNSFISLLTHRSATNPNGAVSAELSALMLLFYAVGCWVSYGYDKNVTALDRLAFVAYIAAPFWAAFVDRTNDGRLRPASLYPILIGLGAIAGAFVIGRLRGHDQRAEAK